MTDRTPHVTVCEKDSCEVCHSWLVEQKQLWGWVYFYIRQLEDTAEDRDNHTLGDF